MDVERLSRAVERAATRREAAAAVVALALGAWPGAAVARRLGGGLIDFEECQERLMEDICRALPFYDRRACGRSVDRCCKPTQGTLRNATRCVQQGLPRRP